MPRIWDDHYCCFVLYWSIMYEPAILRYNQCIMDRKFQRLRLSYSLGIQIPWYNPKKSHKHFHHGICFIILYQGWDFSESQCNPIIIPTLEFYHFSCMRAQIFYFISLNIWIIINFRHILLESIPLELWTPDTAMTIEEGDTEYVLDRSSTLWGSK